MAKKRAEVNFENVGLGMLEATTKATTEATTEATKKEQLKTMGRQAVSAVKKKINLALFVDFMKQFAIAMGIALVAFGITMAVAAAPFALFVFGVVAAASVLPLLIRSIVLAATINSAINKGTKAVSAVFDAVTGAQVTDAVNAIQMALTKPAAQIDTKPTVATATTATTATTAKPVTTATASVASNSMFASAARKGVSDPASDFMSSLLGRPAV